jgi:hypothetical protein
METEILRRGLKMIDRIYRDCYQSQDKDLFRILDIINSLDKKQIQSKQWLVDTLAEYFTPIANSKSKIIIGGGWYGVLGYLLSLKFPDTKIYNTDIDPGTVRIAKMMFPELRNRILDMINNNAENTPDPDNPVYNSVGDNIVNQKQKTLLEQAFDPGKNRVFISTSIEHIDKEDVDSILFYNPNKMIVLQSNNYFDHVSHINCSETLGDFKEYISPMLKEICYAGELNLGDYTRFMIIGRT